MMSWLPPPGQGFLSDKLRMARFLGRLPEPEPGTACEHCGATDGVARVGAFTCYPDDPKPLTGNRFELLEIDVPPDEEARLIEQAARECPNRDRYLCDACAREDEIFWREQWDEYHRGLL